MDFTNSSAIMSLVELASGIGGLWYLGLKIVREVRKAKKHEADRIIQECKELDLVVKNKLEAKIDMLESQINNLEFNMSKDLSNMKENYTLELSNLSERIQVLRSDLQSQHIQILELLTQLVKNPRS